MRRISMLFTAVCFLTFLVAMTGCKTDEDLTPEGVSYCSSEENAAEENNASPLRVLIDVEYGSNVYRLRDELTRYRAEYIDGEEKPISFQTWIDNMCGLSSVEIEIAPIRENERDIYLTSLRTEMMSGGGPDVFVSGAAPVFTKRKRATK